MISTLLQVLTFFSTISSAWGQTAYANDFIDPDYILSRNFGPQTERAQATIVSWAQTLAQDGPWSVMNKTITPPSGDKHDYLSWAPYWWPNCTGVPNAATLTDEQIWTTCPYITRDGLFNPDVRLVNDTGHFQAMAEAVLYNTLAWTLNTTTSAQKTIFEETAVSFLNMWFLNPETAMNPNLNFGQMQRGTNGVPGSHTGVLDLKCMAKVASAVLLLRKGKSTAWTSGLDNQMISWSTKYITWLETAKIAVEESLATNNHGTFYYNQLGALKLIVNDIAGAKNATDTYFDTLYLAQISANGEQPLEAVRTRPYHYRNYNLAAMITNARISQYVNSTSNMWQKPTKQGATIKSALDFALTVNASTSSEQNVTAELYPNIAAIASVYGDTSGKYLNFLNTQDPSFISEPFILWNQPFANGFSGGVLPSSGSTTSGGAPAPTSSAGKLVYSWATEILSIVVAGVVATLL